MGLLRRKRASDGNGSPWIGQSTAVAVVFLMVAGLSLGLFVLSSATDTSRHLASVSRIDQSSGLTTAFTTPGIAGYHWFSPGGNPRSIAYDNASGDLYVTLETSNSVDVLSDTTGTHIGTVSVGSNDIGDAYSPFSNSVYVANYNSGTISVIKALGVTKTITVTGCPNGVVLDSKNKDVYVTNPCGNNVTVISTTTNKVVAALPANNPQFPGYNPSTGDVWVPNYGAYNVTVFSSKNAVVGYIPFSYQPYDAAYDAAANRMFVALAGSYVSVLNGLAFVTNISVCGGTSWLAYDPLDQLVYANSCGEVQLLNTTAVVAGNSAEVNNPQQLTYDPGTGDMLVANYGNGQILVYGGAWLAPEASLTLSKEPTGIATTPNGYAYVANEAGSSVTVLDTLDGSIVKTIGVGHKPLGITYDAAQNTIFVANSGSANVTVISAATDTVVANVSTGAVPTGISYDPVDSQVDVTDFGASSVSVIDATTDTLAATIGVGSAPTGIDASSGTVYVANSANDNVTVINGATNSVSWSVAVAADPQGVLYDQGWIFVADEGSNAVSAIYAYTSTSVSYTFGTDSEPYSLAVAGDTLLIGCVGSDTIDLTNLTANAQGSHNIYAGWDDVGGPQAMAYLPEDGSVFVTHGSTSNLLSVRALSPDLDFLQTSVGSGTYAVGGAFDSANGDLYVAERGANSVAVFSGGTNAVVTTVAVGKDPDGVAYDPTSQYVYVSNGGASTVTVINGSTNKVVATVTVGKDPGIPTYDPKAGDVFVPNAGSNNVSVLSGSSVAKSVAVGSAPTSATYDPKNSEVLVTNQGSNNVSLLSGTSPFSVAKNLAVGSAPENSAYDATTGDMFVVNGASGNLSIIASTGVVVHTLDLGTRVGLTGAIAFSAGAGEMYVGENATDLVVVLSGYNRVASFLNGYGVAGFVYDPATGALYIANPDSDSIGLAATGL